MNFGWLNEGAPADEWNRVVLHEFGHALGCIHEHSSPNFLRQWDRDKVLEQFGRPPHNWSADRIQHNILDKTRYSIEATKYDADSIMLYMFDGRLFNDGGGPTNSNATLSVLDKRMIGDIYPRIKVNAQREGRL
jgi:hypothetical protein